MVARLLSLSCQKNGRGIGINTNEVHGAAADELVDTWTRPGRPNVTLVIPLLLSFFTRRRFFRSNVEEGPKGLTRRKRAQVGPITTDVIESRGYSATCTLG
jgi:hypothetical protein